MGKEEKKQQPQNRKLIVSYIIFLFITNIHMMVISGFKKKIPEDITG